jgi:transposase
VPAPLRARMIVGGERAAIEQLARSRTAPARAVERARIVLLSRLGDGVEEIAEKLGVCPATVRLWLNRFNRQGIEGLADRPRSGRPAVYRPEQVGEVVATSLTDPQALGLPFASWTLDRLAAYLAEEKNLPIKRSRIGEILTAEGLRWREQETWFGERVDPEFAAKRGRSSRPTRSRRRAAS